MQAHVRCCILYMKHSTLSIIFHPARAALTWRCSERSLLKISWIMGLFACWMLSLRCQFLAQRKKCLLCDWCNFQLFFCCLELLPVVKSTWEHEVHWKQWIKHILALALLVLIDLSLERRLSELFRRNYLGVRRCCF